MKVLLTGATGFVGSHILDALCLQEIEVVALLRPTSNRQFIARRLERVEVRIGALDDPASLRQALRDVSHVIHCAGLTKALNRAGFIAGNRLGTRHVIEAINAQGAVQRLVHISSLAVGGPAPPERPAREDDPPRPVSVYGESKLGGEDEVKRGCQAPYVIVRPAAVYGPRDDGFFSLFQAVKRRVIPRFMGSLAALSMIYAKDLAAAVVVCLTHPAATQRTYYAASPEVLRGEAFAREIARQMNVRAVTLPLPAPLVWSACVVQEGISQLRRRPQILGLQKYRELRAPGWVCDSSRLREELGYVAGTPHAEGIAETLAWYRQEGWL